MKYILKKLLKFKKYKALLETRQDIQYIKTAKKKAVGADVSKLRTKLGEAKRKENTKKIEELSQLIAERNAIIRELEQLEELESALQEYLKLL